MVAAVLVRLRLDTHSIRCRFEGLTGKGEHWLQQLKQGEHRVNGVNKAGQEASGWLTTGG